MIRFRDRFQTTLLVAFGLVLAMTPTALAQLTSFSVIDYPGARATRLIGINDRGAISGQYDTPDGKTHGFVFRDGQFTAIDFAGAVATGVVDINRSGDVAGYYRGADGKEHSFVLSGGQFTTIPDFPGADVTRVIGMNNKGELVGMYNNLSGDTTHRGFLFSGGRLTSFEHPKAGRMSCLFGINDEGDMVGHWQDKDGVRHGWLIRRGASNSFDYPGAQQTMVDAGGVSSAGDIVGPYTDPRAKTKAFLLTQSTFVSFDIPGSRNTWAQRMNAQGQIVGKFQDASGVMHGFLTRVAPAWRSELLTVDDDGAECPGALKTIQEAVAQAPAEATILVCPGIYTHTVNLVGQANDALKLIAIGHEGEVILQGDYTERDGFHLENVGNVLIRGFTVRDFGAKPTTATEWGEGNQIYLQNAHYNTIQQNRLINGDMNGIMLVDSGNNTITQNVAFADNTNLANYGIHAQGPKSAVNTFDRNYASGNKVAGIMLRSAGPGNVISNNTFVSNGRFGIGVESTAEVMIESNRVSYNRGYWGKTPGGQQPGLGINLVNVDKATVFDNTARGNSGMDLNWDGQGENSFDANACGTSTPAGVCAK